MFQRSEPQIPLAALGVEPADAAAVQGPPSAQNPREIQNTTSKCARVSGFPEDLPNSRLNLSRIIGALDSAQRLKIYSYQAEPPLGLTVALLAGEMASSRAGVVWHDFSFLLVGVG